MEGTGEGEATCLVYFMRPTAGGGGPSSTLSSGVADALRVVAASTSPIPSLRSSPPKFFLSRPPTSDRRIPQVSSGMWYCTSGVPPLPKMPTRWHPSDSQRGRCCANTIVL